MNTRSLAVALILAAAIPASAEDNQLPPPQRIRISLANRTLTLFEDGREIRTWAIAVGKASTPSPEGEWKIVNLVKNPTWYGPAGKVVGPGSANPVGTRWIGLSKKGFGIH